jgi:hypothetical protein
LTGCWISLTKRGHRCASWPTETAVIGVRPRTICGVDALVAEQSGRPRGMFFRAPLCGKGLHFPFTLV